MPKKKTATPTTFKLRTPLKIKPIKAQGVDADNIELPPSEVGSTFQPWLAVGIFLQALVATLGSLYYSSFGDPVANALNGNFFPVDQGFTPCLLCWFARILMYPIVLISYVGIAKKDKSFTDYVLPLSIIGIFLEIYHYALQKLPIHSVFGCSLENPCSALQVNYLGFITIPFLCLTAFTLITVLGLINTIQNHRAKQL